MHDRSERFFLCCESLHGEASIVYALVLHLLNKIEAVFSSGSDSSVAFAVPGLSLEMLIRLMSVQLALLRTCRKEEAAMSDLYAAATEIGSRGLE